MTLTQLTYIVAVDKHRSFLRAAEASFVTQPTLSQQIQKLEEELGVQIFDRQRQPIEPTPLGKKIIAQAQITLKESQKITDLVSESRGDLQGNLQLGVIPTLAPYLLPLFLKKFVNKHPKLQVVVQELQTEQVIEKIHSQEIDIGLLVTPIDDVELVRKPLFMEPFHLYVSESHPLYKEKLVDEKMLSTSEILLMKEGHCFREQSLNICLSKKKNPIHRQVDFESGSLETLKEFVESGEGYTLLPHLATLKMQHSKLLKNFSEPVPSREVSLVYSPHFIREKLVQSLTEAIIEGLPKELHKPGKGTKLKKVPIYR